MATANSPVTQPTALARLRPVLTRSISPENFDGSPGGGGRATEGTGAEAARDLGQGWKVSPSVDVKAGETFTLADIDSAGVITQDRKSTRLNSSHVAISYAVFCLKKKN